MAVIHLQSVLGLRVQAHRQYGVSLVLDEWLVEAVVAGENGTRKQKKFLFLREENFQELLNSGQFILERRSEN